MSVTPPVVLSIAGSDSAAGAGAQVDLRTCAALGVHAATAITALTAQNTLGVAGVLPTPPDFLRLQIRTVLEDLTVRAVKTGFLATPANAEVVAELAGDGRLAPLVVDPVLVDRSGRRIAADELVETYRVGLLPRAAVLTPNVHEAEVLLGWEPGAIADVARQRDAARALGELGASWVVVKGGRLPGGEAVDAVWGEAGDEELVAPWVPTRNDHGTGCTFAAAVAAGLALGLPPSRAIPEAKAFVTRAVAGAVHWRLGAGHGGIDQLGAGATGPRHQVPGPSSPGD